MTDRQGEAKEPVTLRLQLSESDGVVSRAVSTSDLAASEPTSLAPEQVVELVRLGDRLAGEHLSSREELESAGGSLFSAVFSGSALETFVRAHQEAAACRRPLRILVVMPEQSFLHEVPWEILFRQGRFLACSANTAVVRSVPLPSPAPGIECPLPLRMLFTTAEPEGGARLDLAAEEQAIRRSVEAASDSIRLTVEHGIDVERLASLFQDARRCGDPFRIWHHGGHGAVTRDGRFLLLLEKERRLQQVPTGRIGQLVAAEDDLRLAVLNVCFGGSPLGLCLHLSRLDVPAVVGFRGRLFDRVAQDFTRAFYPALASEPIDVAVARTRAALGVSDDFDWSQPVLYGRARRLSFSGSRADEPKRPAVSNARTEFHNRGVRVRRRARQIGTIASGEAAAHAGETRFFNEDLEVGDFDQIGEILLGGGSDAPFAERFADLLESVAGSGAQHGE